MQRVVISYRCFGTTCQSYPQGIRRGAHISGALKDEWRALETGHLSARDCMKGTLRASLLGTVKVVLSKARKWGSASVGAPILGNMEGCFFLRAFLFRGIFMRLSREMLMPCNRVSLSLGTLLGNLEGVHLSGFFTEKKKYIWVPFLDPEDINP